TVRRERGIGCSCEPPVFRPLYRRGRCPRHDAGESVLGTTAQRAFKRLRSSIPPQPSLEKLLPHPPAESQMSPVKPFGLTNFSHSLTEAPPWAAFAFCRARR